MWTSYRTYYCIRWKQQETGTNTIEQVKYLQLLPKEQYGRWKNKSAVKQTLYLHLIFDSIQLSHLPTCYVSKDAKPYYDNIVHTLASLALQYIGMLLSLIICTFSSI